MINGEFCSKCGSDVNNYVEQRQIAARVYKLYCRNCHDYIEYTSVWASTNKHLPQGDERQVLIKTDNGRGGHWINIAWWRPSANIFDDGLSVDYWCEIPG